MALEGAPAISSKRKDRKGLQQVPPREEAAADAEPAAVVVNGSGPHTHTVAAILSIESLRAFATRASSSLAPALPLKDGHPTSCPRMLRPRNPAAILCSALDAATTHPAAGGSCGAACEQQYRGCRTVPQRLLHHRLGSGKLAASRGLHSCLAPAWALPPPLPPAASTTAVPELWGQRTAWFSTEQPMLG